MGKDEIILKLLQYLATTDEYKVWVKDNIYGQSNLFTASGNISADDMMYLFCWLTQGDCEHKTTLKERFTKYLNCKKYFPGTSDEVARNCGKSLKVLKNYCPAECGGKRNGAGRPKADKFSGLKGESTEEKEDSLAIFSKILSETGADKNPQKLLEAFKKAVIVGVVDDILAISGTALAEERIIDYDKKAFSKHASSIRLALSTERFRQRKEEEGHIVLSRGNREMEA